MPKILIIDDDPAALRMLSRILKSERHHVIEAGDGIEGLRKFWDEAPDLIVTDIIMPVKEGIETIAEIRASGSKVGIIAISGGGAGVDDLYLKMAEEFGADAVLSKPFRREALLSLVDGLLDRNGLD